MEGRRRYRAVANQLPGIPSKSAGRVSSTDVLMGEKPAVGGTNLGDAFLAQPKSSWIPSTPARAPRWLKEPAPLPHNRRLSRRSPHRLIATETCPGQIVPPADRHFHHACPRRSEIESRITGSFASPPTNPNTVYIFVQTLPLSPTPIFLLHRKRLRTVWSKLDFSFGVAATTTCAIFGNIDWDDDDWNHHHDDDWNAAAILTATW